MKERVISVAVQLAIIGGLWYAMGLVWQLVAVLAGAAVLPLLFPHRFERIASGIALLGVAAFFYFWGGSGYAKLAGLLALVGVGLIIYGAVKLRDMTGARSAD
jgi:hypothetical protein